MENININQTVSNEMINLQVTWNQPTTDRPVQRYEVQYKRQGISSWTSVTPNPTTRQTTIRNVDKGSVYKVRVRAVSDVGYGQWRSATSDMSDRGKLINFQYMLTCCYIYKFSKSNNSKLIHFLYTYRATIYQYKILILNLHNYLLLKNNVSYHKLTELLGD